MAALEPTRRTLTAFTIESIVGRSSPSPPPSSTLPSRPVNDSVPPDQRSPTDSGSDSTLTSTTGAGVPAATSAGRHLEMLARFATPNLTGCRGPFSTSVILGGGNAGGMTLAEALLRAGGHHLPCAAVELVQRGNGFAGPATTPRLHGQTSTPNSTGQAELALFRASTWTPQDLARRVPTQGWPASLVHPLTTCVRPPAGHTYMHHPYAGKYYYIFIFIHRNR